MTESTSPTAPLEVIRAALAERLEHGSRCKPRRDWVHPGKILLAMDIVPQRFRDLELNLRQKNIVSGEQAMSTFMLMLTRLDPNAHCSDVGLIFSLHVTLGIAQQSSTWFTTCDRVEETDIALYEYVPTQTGETLRLTYLYSPPDL